MRDYSKMSIAALRIEYARILSSADMSDQERYLSLEACDAVLEQKEIDLIKELI